MEEDPENIQWEADGCISAVKIWNERRWLEWEYWRWKEEEEWWLKEEEEKQKWRDEKNQKKEEAAKEAYEKILSKAQRKQLQLSLQKLPFFPGVEHVPDFKKAEGDL